MSTPEHPSEQGLASPRLHPLYHLMKMSIRIPLDAVALARRRSPVQIQERLQAVENRIRVARWIGEMVVQQGQKELVKQWTTSSAQIDPSGEPELDPDTEARLEVEGDVDGVSGVETPGITAQPEPDPPRASELPIEGYESLAALHVVQRLGGLDPDELERVRRFETATRARRTILAKIAQLQDA